MKKTVCIIMILLLACTCVLGCRSGAGNTDQPAAMLSPDPVQENNVPDPTNAAGMDVNATLPPTSYNASQVSGTDALSGASFVMIYNPLIFDEYDSLTNYRTALSTGSFGSQIVTGLNRAGGIEEEIPTGREMISQSELLGDFNDEHISYESGRAGGTDPVYTVNATHSFYSGCGLSRRQRDFTCVYAGSSCYIWSEGTSISADDAARLGKIFDEKIYPMDVTYFGTPRFTENGGKVNILFYPLPSDGLCGFFHMYDIFSSQELLGISQAEMDYYGLNTDHAIININSKLLAVDEEMVLSTLAHELQHQICATNKFVYLDTPYMRTWLNEAMSAYAEELNYPGIKVRAYEDLNYYVSDSYRTGQSLYNFSNDNDPYLGDYGVVYLFGKYLDKFADSNVYHKVHEYWRNSYSANISEATALYASVPATFVSAINEKYSYPQSISSRFANKEEEWMSKMTLDFFIETVSPELAELTPYADAIHLYMLYAEINPVSIEGGGRVLVATENGSYTIPKDAGTGLIYVGFDKNFNVIGIVYPNA